MVIGRIQQLSFTYYLRLNAPVIFDCKFELKFIVVVRKIFLTIIAFALMNMV
jgi:hypothetical protein